MKYLKMILGAALIIAAMCGLFISMPLGDNFTSPSSILLKQFVSILLLIIGVRLIIVNLRKEKIVE